MFRSLLFRSCYLLVISATLSINNSFAQDLPSEPEAIAEGETLWKANCTVCHAVHKKVIGPALKDVVDKYDGDIAYLTRFIQNSQAVINVEKDPRAVAIWEEYKPTVMTSFTNLSDAQVANVLAYIMEESANPPVEASAAAQGGDAAAAGTAGGGIAQNYLYLIIGGLALVLILVLAVLILLISVLTRLLKQREDLEEEDRQVLDQGFDFNKLLRNPTVIGFLAFFFTAIVVKTVIDGLFNIGVQQDYAPIQPIAFSHEIHAGQYEIECVYCHTGVYKSKSANIPSANICMNCHTHIKPESPEIQKIYAAIDYDPETATYGEDIKPIEWVRVHNLPDLAYFNHSQHTVVGEIECETCHGPIQEMEVVGQYASLTMGWCINCHRETEVNAEGNDYYNKLLEWHSTNNDDEPMVVEDIGGLECVKCHY